MVLIKVLDKMGQGEVLSLLEKSKNWDTTEEIANKLKANIRVVRRVLLVLVKYKEVSRKKCENSTHFKYIYKIR